MASPFYYIGQRDAGLVNCASGGIMQIAGQLKGIPYHFPLLTCGLANEALELMRRIIDAPAALSAQDAQRMRAILALLSIQPGMPFVSAYKTILAEQTGDDAWLRVKAPLTLLSQDENDAVRAAYRQIPC